MPETEAEAWPQVVEVPARSKSMRNLSKAAAQPQGKQVLRQAWRESAPGLAVVLLLSIFINVLMLATPIYVLQILDRVIASRSVETLYMLTAIVLIAVLSGVLLEVIRRRLMMHWGGWIERRFAPALFETGLLESDGESSRSLKDLAQIRTFVSGQGLLAWLDVAWAPLFIACVYLITPALATVILLGCLIALALGTVNEYLTRDARNASVKARDEGRDLASMADRHRETVVARTVVQRLTAQWADAAFSARDESQKARTIHVYFAAAMRLVGRFVRIAVLGVGIWLVIVDGLSLGSVIAAGFLGRTAYSLVQATMLRWREMVVTRRAYGRMSKSLERQVGMGLSRPRADAPHPLVLSQVAFRYPGQARSLLRRISMTVEPGDVLCVTGPCAAGKSTLCRLLNGLLRPRAGKIQLGEVDIHRLQRHSDRREIGFLPQETTLFPGTLRENIAGMAQGDMKEVVAAAELVGVHDVITALPEGYDTQTGESDPALSVGQRKLVAIARAFYAAPPLIILDEPSPHLDEQGVKSLISGIQTLKSGGSIVVLTTQNEKLWKIADKMIVLDPQKARLLASRDEVVSHQRGSIRKANSPSGSRRSSKREAEADSSDKSAPSAS